jgi:hypothetical protein
VTNGQGTLCLGVTRHAPKAFPEISSAVAALSTKPAAPDRTTSCSSASSGCTAGVPDSSVIRN